MPKVKRSRLEALITEQGNIFYCEGCGNDNGLWNACGHRRIYQACNICREWRVCTKDNMLRAIARDNPIVV